MKIVPDTFSPAGNSSQMSDGAGAVLLASEKAIKQYNLQPLARFVGFSVAGVPPEVMGIGPKEAIPKALAQTGITQDQLDCKRPPTTPSPNIS